MVIKGISTLQLFESTRIVWFPKYVYIYDVDYWINSYNLLHKQEHTAENIEWTVDGHSFYGWSLHKRKSHSSSTSAKVIFFHGNGSNRASNFANLPLHYQRLLEIDLIHEVIAPDYRGYGDSPWISITEQTAVEDVIKVIEHVLSNSGNSIKYLRVYLRNRSVLMFRSRSLHLPNGTLPRLWPSCSSTRKNCGFAWKFG